MWIGHHRQRRYAPVRLEYWAALVEQMQTQRLVLMQRSSNVEDTMKMYYDQLPAQPRIVSSHADSREERLPFLAQVTPGGVHDIAVSPAGPPQFDFKARPLFYCAYDPLVLAAAAWDNKLVVAPSLQCAGMGVYPAKDFKAR